MQIALSILNGQCGWLTFEIHEMEWKKQLILTLQMIVSVMIAVALLKSNSDLIQPVAFLCLIIIAVKYGIKQ